MSRDRHSASQRATAPATVGGVDDAPAGGLKDDAVDRPHVTPEPTPPDDGLFRMAGAGTAIAALLLLLAYRWLRSNVVVTRR